MRNLDEKTVEGFGHEWSEFDQFEVPQDELEEIFTSYFELVDWAGIREDATAFDLGCGSGRWAQFVAPKVGCLHCIDPSADALNIARRNLSGLGNCVFHQATVEDVGLESGSIDLGYSLGVLDHVPDPLSAFRRCYELLKPGAMLLLYMYYAFDDKPRWFRAIWRVSDVVRRGIARLPHRMKVWVTSSIAALVYVPLARIASLLHRKGRNIENMPLAFYRDKSFLTMRTDAYDRFATRLERRYTKADLRNLLLQAGFEDVRFAEGMPYWRLLATKPR